MSEDLLELFLNRSYRATVSYTGISGMPALENAGNVLRTETSLRISIRVPPHCSAEDAAKELKEVLEKVFLKKSAGKMTVIGSSIRS